MLNLRKKNEEIKKLKQLVATQKDTIDKAMMVIDHQIAENIKLQDENKKLKDLVEFHKYMRSSPDDIIFPNTDYRGLNDPSNSEPEGLDNIY